jgi:hypothetical protein
VDQIIGAADVRDDREVVASLIEQHRIVRGDQSVVPRTDDRRPGIRVDHAADLRDIGKSETGVLTHPLSLEPNAHDRRRRPVHAWQRGHQ